MMGAPPIFLGLAPQPQSTRYHSAVILGSNANTQPKITDLSLMFQILIISRLKHSPLYHTPLSLLLTTNQRCPCDYSTSVLPLMQLRMLGAEVLVVSVVGFLLVIVIVTDMGDFASILDNLIAGGNISGILSRLRQFRNSTEFRRPTTAARAPVPWAGWAMLREASQSISGPIPVPEAATRACIASPQLPRCTGYGKGISPRMPAYAIADRICGVCVDVAMDDIHLIRIPIRLRFFGAYFGNAAMQ